MHVVPTNFDIFTNAVAEKTKQQIAINLQFRNILQCSVDVTNEWIAQVHRFRLILDLKKAQLKHLKIRIRSLKKDLKMQTNLIKEELKIKKEIKNKRKISNRDLKSTNRRLMAFKLNKAHLLVEIKKCKQKAFQLKEEIDSLNFDVLKKNLIYEVNLWSNEIRNFELQVNQIYQQFISLNRLLNAPNF